MTRNAVAIALIIFASANPSFATEPVELWGGLTEGMSPEMVASLLRAKEGIKGVSVKATKEGVYQVDVKYVNQGLMVAGQQSRLDFSFHAAALRSVTIRPLGGYGDPYCISKGQVAHKYYTTLLSQKYERNLSSPFDFDDMLVARMRLDRSGSARYRPIVEAITEGFTDGKVQVFNIARITAAEDFSGRKGNWAVFQMTYARCARDAGLYAHPSLVYFSKATADELRQNKKSTDQSTIEALSKDL
jgi:hypothetical protein